MKSNLPTGWEEMSVKEATDNIPLTGYKLPQTNYQSEGVLPVIDQGQSFISGYTDKVELQAPCASPVIVFGDHTRAFKYIDFDFVAGADGIKVLSPKGFYIPKLLFYFAKAVEIPNRGYGRHFKFLAEAKIPLPPLAEQQRILSKLEAITQKLEASQERLEKLPILLKKFRQAVLAAAVSGKLTEAWRAEQPQGATATELLNRAVKNVKLYQKSKYKEIVFPSVNGLNEVPTGWDYTFIAPLLDYSRKGMITGPFGSALKKHEHQAVGIPVLGIENIGKHQFFYESKIHVTPEKADELKSFDARPGDIIISRSGTVGEICVVPEDMEYALISTNLLRISLNHDVINPKYFSFLFRGSRLVLDKVKELCKGSTRDFLNQGILKQLVFALPPLAEQQEIVRQVNHYFGLADQLQARLEQVVAMVEQLPQALLAKAFSGQLVPQDPNDEPASALLERLQTSASAPTKGQRGRKLKDALATPLFN